MSKKNKAKLNKEDELEKNNSDIINSENENLEQNCTVANDIDADNEKQNELEENLRDEIIHILAYSEVSIDYAQEDLPLDLVKQIKEKLQELKKSLNSTLVASKSREGLMQGFKVAIVGKPNVGKSSLLNALLNYNRAIVSNIAGTTRDTIEERVKIGTHLINIVDTAGIREANDEIERIGIERSLEAIEQSDIVIALFDNSRQKNEEDTKF